MSKIITPRKTLPRRAILGGAGALLTLPLFESLLGKTARADEVAPLRTLSWYVPCGIHMAKWTPAAEGANYALTEILTPLGAMKSKVNVLTGLNNIPARPDGPGDHASGTGAFLTVAHPKKTEGADVLNGISMDQVAANELKQFTRIPSMQLGIDGGNGVGNCDSGYSCAYAHNISWASSTQPLQKTVNPSVVWDQLFSGFDPGESAELKAKKMLYRKSILDFVEADTTRIQKQLGKTDQVKLDQYLNGVRELELKIDKTTLGPSCEPSEKPDGIPGDVTSHIDMMSDLMALAFQCDATRVISFMAANAGSNRSYGFLGLSGGHHEWSHHNQLQSNLDALTVVDTWEVERFTYLLNKLDEVTDVDGKTMLDNSLVFFSSEIEDGNSHAHTNMPILLGGGGGGAVTPGRHIRYGNDESVAKLFISVLKALKVPVVGDAFGDATGELPNLKV